MSGNHQSAIGGFVNSSFAPLVAPTTIFNQTSGVIWLVGGSVQFASEPTNAVWTTTDMMNWRAINGTNTIFTPRTLAVGGVDLTAQCLLSADKDLVSANSTTFGAAPTVNSVDFNYRECAVQSASGSSTRRQQLCSVRRRCDCSERRH